MPSNNREPKNRICIIGCQIGKFNNYFSLWLKSAAFNNQVDFIVFTDQKITPLPYKNIRFYHITLDLIKSKAQEIFGFSVSLDKPYKLCDYKPAYGIIFEEYIKQYDYWGHCDFDMIFGDLMCFFKSNNLYAYDRFGPCGHLTLYKNTPENNGRFKMSGVYVDVFKSPKNFWFDEVETFNIYLKNGFPFFKKRFFANIDTHFRRFRISDGYKCNKKIKNYKYQIFYFDNGKVYRAYYKNSKLQTEEFAYIHLQSVSYCPVNFNGISNKFFIARSGFFEMENLSKKLIKHYNKYSLPIEMYEIIKRKLRVFLYKRDWFWKIRGFFEVACQYIKSPKLLLKKFGIKNKGN